MPVRRTPRSLEELSRRRACEDLDKSCRKLQSLSMSGGSSCNRVLDYARRVLRPYYVSSLPGNARSRLIEETSRMLSEGASSRGSVLFSSPTPLYLLTILLGRDTRRLTLDLCCYYGCSHQADLLRLLAKEASGLVALAIARTSLLRMDCRLLRDALRSMKNLRSLTMRNIASDSVLEVIGRACSSLAVLDVSCSQQVTDHGLEHLFVRLKFLTNRDEERAGEAKKSPNGANEDVDDEDENDGGDGDDDDDDRRCYRRRRCDPRRESENGTTWSKLKALLTRIRSKTEKNPRNEEYLLGMSETRNPICESLRALNLGKTSVTAAGVSVALRRATNLRSLFDYGHAGAALEIASREEAFSPLPSPSAGPANPRRRFDLREARDTDPSARRLETIAATCPLLEKLSVQEARRLSAATLRAFTSLACLVLDSLPADATVWIDQLLDYLSTDGAKLRELSLRAVNEDFRLNEEASPRSRDIDLRSILVRCPNLESLTSEAARVRWSKGKDPPPLRRLARVRIGEIASAKAVAKILGLAPELAAIRVRSCNELTDRNLEILRNEESSSSLLLSTSYSLLSSSASAAAHPSLLSTSASSTISSLSTSPSFSSFGSTSSPNDLVFDDPSVLANHESTRLMKNLKCFYVDEAHKISAEGAINMLKYCRNLRHIGNLVNWGLNREEVGIVENIVASRNVDTEICSAEHPFWNTCCRD